MFNNRPLHEELRSTWQSMCSNELRRTSSSVVESKTTGDLDICKLRSTYEKHDYVILRFKCDVTLADVTNVLKKLGLSSAYIPSYYEDSLVQYEHGFNRIGKDVGFNHSGFSSCDAQDLHTDGTLTKLGEIRTSTLFCKNQAPIGGETIIFHSCRAFLDAIFVHGIDLAFLIEKPCLSKTAVDLDFSNVVEPAFSVINSELLTRYSLDNTSSWVGLSGRESMSLQNFIEKFQLSDEYVDEFLLSSNDLLIMRNSKLSHGRRAYTDTSSESRLMHRAIFTHELFPLD